MILPFPLEDFAPLWNKVATTIRRSYYARDARHAEMERRLAEAAPLAKAATDRRTFQKAVNAMIDGFHDSHFELLTDEDQGYYAMDGLMSDGEVQKMPQVGAWFAKSPDGYTVQMTLEGGAAERAGLRVGDLITHVDGAPFSPVVALASRVGTSPTFGYRRGSVESETRVAVTRTSVPKMFLDATLASRRTVERGGKRFATIHLWTQGSDDFFKAMEKALADAREADGFILDLRGGFGGFFSGYEEAIRAYPKPIVVLIDRGSRSAKEVLSFNLQRHKVARLVGETTAGHVLGTMPLRLNAWSYLEIPMVDLKLDGVRLEGRGVTPDVVVPAGEDPFERAIDLLASKRP